jgi:predicted O-methyltransferase YrrM
MITNKSIQNLFFELDDTGFYDNLSCPITPWIDTCVLLMLGRKIKAKQILEVGTHRGYTTRILADKFPDAHIITVDPGDQIPEDKRPLNQKGEYLSQDEIGEQVRDKLHVQIIRRQFKEINWGVQQFDLIYIDGDHTFGPVYEDSLLAQQLLADHGIIVWHDRPLVEQSLRLLNIPIVFMNDTQIAYHWRQ